MKKSINNQSSINYLRFILISAISLFSLIICISLQAQESINASGNDASGAGGDVSYSVGQLLTNTISSPSGSLKQGVQIAYIIEEQAGINENEELSVSYTIFPNPTTDLITIKTSDLENNHLSEFQLFDINGKQFYQGEINANETSLNMESYSAGTYFLKIIQVNESITKEIKTYKIIKN